MHGIIVHWQNPFTRYGLRATTGTILLTQDNNDDPASGETHTKYVQRDTRDLSNVKWFK